VNRRRRGRSNRNISKRSIRAASTPKLERRPDSARNLNVRWKRRIGILGGLGPFAHLELEKRLLEAATRLLGRPLRDQEFPPWILVSLPQIPDRTAAVVSGGASPIPSLLEGLQLLKDTDFVVVACNTAHVFMKQVRSQIKVPILDIVAETIRAVAEESKPSATVALLGSAATLHSGLYEQTARAIGSSLRFITPLDLTVGDLGGAEIQQRYVTDLIFGESRRGDRLKGGIKAGAHHDPHIRLQMEKRLMTLLGWLADAGARTVILGCTELPLILTGDSAGRTRLIDPLKVAASVAVEIAAGVHNLPE
jgi:aspartate racemase